MADLSINSFKANFLGGARPGLYSVEMTFPTGVTNGLRAAQKLQFMCKSAGLPGTNIGSIEVGYMARKIPIPGDREPFGDISLTIINDTDWIVREAFEKWHNLVNTHETNLGIANIMTLTTDFNMRQLNRDGTILKTYKLVSAFPTQVGDIGLSYDTTSQVEEFTVSIKYAYWQTENIL